MKKRRRTSRISPLAAAVIFLVVAIPAVYLGFTKAIPFQHYYEIRAAFHNAVDIRNGSPVRIAGVNVGVVDGVEPVPGGKGDAYVKMRIEDKGRPIKADATARIRPRIFLEGNFFVELSPGTPSAKEIPDGGTIPVNQTTTAVQLDQVLTSLQGGTRKNLQGLLRDYGAALDRGAKGFNRSIRYWKQAYSTGTQVNDAFRGLRPHDLSGYIRAGGAAAAAIDQHPQRLKDLVRYFRIVAGAFAVEQDNLSATVNELPRTLETGRPALAALDRAFPPTRRLVAALRPGVRSTGPMIDASLPFVRQLRGLVQPAELRGLVGDLRPTIPALASVQSSTVPLLRQVRAASSCQNEVILPWTHDTVPNVENFKGWKDRPIYQEAVKFLPGIARESASGDANGQWFRVLLGTGNIQLPGLQGVLGSKLPVIGKALLPLSGLVPAKPAYRPPIRPNAPCETQQRPDVRAIPTLFGSPADAPNGLGTLLQNLLNVLPGVNLTNVPRRPERILDGSLNASGQKLQKRSEKRLLDFTRKTLKAEHLKARVVGGK